MMEASTMPRSEFNQLSPQCRKVLSHMERTGSISCDEAITYFRVMSLSRRINDLERSGVPILRTRRKHPTTGQHYVRYHLVN